MPRSSATDSVAATNGRHAGETDVTTTVSRAIRESLAEGLPTVERVAQLTSLTPRTLQRKLRNAGSSFSKLLTLTRLEVAQESLGEGLTVTQLAPALGFSESSAVSRFLRQHGLNPRAPNRLRSARPVNIGPESIVEAVYESEAPDRWTRVIDVLGLYFGASATRIMVTHPTTNELVFDAVTQGVPADLKKDYDEHYLPTDPRIPGVLARLGTPVSCADIVDPHEFDKSALVNDLLDRPGVGRWHMLQAAFLGGRELMIAGTGRPRPKGPFLVADRRKLDFAAGHVRRALDIELRLDLLKKREALLEDALETAADGVVVVSRELDVLHATGTAARMIAYERGLRLVHGKLHAIRPADQLAIDQVLAAADGVGGFSPVATIFAPDGRQTTLRAHRLPRLHFARGGDRRLQFALLLTIKDGSEDL